MILTIPYQPHAKQVEVHDHKAPRKVVAAGRRGGKTILAINELIRRALASESKRGKIPPRFWYVSPSYKQSEAIAWKTLLNYLPDQLIQSKNTMKLQIELVNGVLIEFKGATDDPAKLKGVGLQGVILDEYGSMREEVWHDIFAPMLMDTRGWALFIGTPEPDGSPHFYELFQKGQGLDPDWKSWLFYTADNPHIPREEIERAKREYHPDRYKREFEADFTITAGLIYDNFKHATHVVPSYEPDASDFIVGSIDPGLHNPTAALLTAWNKDGEGIVFKEYYQAGLLAGENAKQIAKMAAPYKVGYWVIDRSAAKRDPASGITVLGKYDEVFRPHRWQIITAPNDPGSVWAGIDSVKDLFHINPLSGRPKLRLTHQCHKTQWELGQYVRYKHKWFVEKNEEEKPRKLHDHAMDCIRNMVMTQPWKRRVIQIHRTENYGY